MRAVSVFTKLFHVDFTLVFIMFISMLLNEDIIDFEKPDGICSLTSVVYDFSELFLNLSVVSIIHSRSE